MIAKKRSHNDSDEWAFFVACFLLHFGKDDSSRLDAYSHSRALAPITIRLKSAAIEPSGTNSSNSDSIPYLHLLPCRIAHTGPANVPNYFRPTKGESKTAVLAYGVDGQVLEQGQYLAEGGLIIYPAENLKVTFTQTDDQLECLSLSPPFSLCCGEL